MTPPRNSDLIREILAERQRQNAVILSIPALPPKPTIGAQSVPETPQVVFKDFHIKDAEGDVPPVPNAPAPTPAPAAPTPQEPPAVPLTEAELASVLDKLLPGITAAATTAIAAFQARRLTVPQAIALGTTLLGVVSTAMKDGAPLIKGTSAYTLVTLIFTVVFDRFLAPLLPVWARPFAPFIKANVVTGLESLYQAVVKRAPAAAPL